MADLGKDLAAVEAELREQWQDTRRRWGDLFVELGAARQAESVGDVRETRRRLEAAEEIYVAALAAEPCDRLHELAAVSADKDGSR